jgi:hypothetical protein
LRLPIVGIAAKMSPRAIPPKVIVGPIADHQVVIVPKPAITLSIAPNNVANARAARTTSINASVACIVAIYKLAAFFVVMPVIITIATACVSPNYWSSDHGRCDWTNRHCHDPCHVHDPGPTTLTE